MKHLHLDFVDAFTLLPFAGNPAGVCLLDHPRDPAWMQAVAAEMNLSETAFLLPGKEAWSLRWFTPRMEVDLCGHATLASAHVLWERGLLDPHAAARFDTRSGRLSAQREGDFIVMDFPADPVVEVPLPPGLTEALGAKPLWTGKGRFDFLLEFRDETEILGLRPDFGRLAALETRGIIVTAPGDGKRADFVSRFFAPRAGVNEDPVTGSANCSLACFWHGRTGRTQFRAVQVSARGGFIHVELQKDRVKLGGQAITVIRGQLLDLDSS